MDKKNVKKYIVILFIIFVVLLITIIFIKIYSKSQNYIISLLRKGDNNINYVISYNKDELIDYVKGNEEKLIFSNGSIYYANYESGEAIFIDVDNKTIELKSVNKDDNPHANIYIKDFEHMNFSYINIREINSNKCIVVELTDNKEHQNEKYLTKRIFINKELGVIERVERYSSTIYDEDTLITKKNYNLHTGEALNEDVKKPDLDQFLDYKIIDERIK